jgi:transposase
MKPKLNEEMIAKLCKPIAEGNYFVVACRLAGISEQSFYSWLKQAEADIKAGVESRFTELYESVKRAESEAEAKMIQVVISNAVESKNWVSAMTFLERRHPERWGRKDRIQVDKEEAVQINVVIKHYQDETQLAQPVARVIEGEARELLPEGENEEVNDKLIDK